MKRKKTKLSANQAVMFYTQKNIKDNEKKKAIIVDVNSLYRVEQKLGLVYIIYEIKCEKEKRIFVEDTFYFKDENSNGIQYNVNRLNKLLENFNIKLNENQLRDVSTIESAIKHLIGEEVVIKQKSGTNLKKQYKICSVISGKRE